MCCLKNGRGSSKPELFFCIFIGGEEGFLFSHGQDVAILHLLSQ